VNNHVEKASHMNAANGSIVFRPTAFHQPDGACETID
jgi:hypothetical protein